MRDGSQVDDAQHHRVRRPARRRRHGAARRYRGARGSGQHARTSGSRPSSTPIIRACRSIARRSTTSPASSTSRIFCAGWIAKGAKRRKAKADKRRSRQKLPAAGLSLTASRTRCRRQAGGAARAIFCSCRRRCRPPISWSRCRRAISTWRSSSMSMAAPTDSSRSRIWSRRSSATFPTSTIPMKGLLIKGGEGIYIADGRVDIEELEDLVKIDLLPDDGRRRPIRWPASSSRWPAACRSAAKSSATAAASNSRSSIPIRGA